MLVYSMAPFMLIICGNYVSFKTTLWSNKDKHQQSFALHKSNYLFLLQIIFMSCPLLLFFQPQCVCQRIFLFFVSVLVSFYWIIVVRV